MSRIFLLLFIFSIFVIYPVNSWALSCIKQATPAIGFEQSQVVFLATVNNIEKGKYEYINTYYFNIDKVWKGNVGEKLTYTPGKNMDDYRHLKKGESYLIYAYNSQNKKNKNKYKISTCSRTKNAKNAEIEMQYLDAITNKKNTKTIDISITSILKNSNNPTQIIEALDFLNVSIRSTAPKQDILQSITELTKNLSPDVRQKLAEVIGNRNLFGNKIVINALKILLKDKDDKVYLAAVSSMAKIGGRTEQSYKAIKETFSMHIKKDKKQENDKYQQNISRFLSSLAKIAPKEKQDEILNLLMEYIPKLEGYPKINLIQQVGFMKGKSTKAVPMLLKELEKTTSKPFGVRQYTILSLGWIGDKRAINPIAQYLTDSNCYVTKEATISLSMIGGEEAVTIIKNRAIPELIKRFDKCTYEFSIAFAELKELSLPALPILIKKYKSSKTQKWTKELIKPVLKSINTPESLAIIKNY